MNRQHAAARNRLFSVTLALALTTATWAAETGTPAAPPPDPGLHAVEQALQGRRHDEALRLAEALVAQRPGQAAPLRAQGDALLGLGQLDGARSAYDSALAVQAEDGLALAGACRVRLLLRQDRARPFCSKAIPKARWRRVDYLNAAHSALMDNAPADARPAYLRVARSVAEQAEFEQQVLADFDTVFAGTPQAAEADATKAWLREEWKKLDRARADVLAARVPGHMQEVGVALRAARSAFEVLTAAGTPSSDTPDAHHRRLNYDALIGYFRLLAVTNGYDEMLRVSREMLDTKKEWYESESNRFLQGQADALAWMGRTAEALAAYEKAIAEQQKSHPPDRALIATHLTAMARLQMDHDDFDAARATLQRLAPAIDEVPATDARRWSVEANALVEGARVLMLADQVPRAEALLLGVLADAPENNRAFNAVRGQVLARLAEVRTLQGRHDEALDGHRSAAGLMRSQLAESNSQVIEHMVRHAVAFAVAGRHGDAVQTLAQAVALSEQHLGPAHPVTAARLSLLAAWRDDGTDALAQAGRQAAATATAPASAPGGAASANSTCRAALAQHQPSAACALAVELGGGQSQDVLNLGHSLLLAGDAQAAQQHYLQVARTVVLEDVFRRDVMGSFDTVFQGTGHIAEARRLKTLVEQRWRAVTLARADYLVAKAHGEARRHDEALAPALRAYEVLDEAGPPASDANPMDPLLPNMALAEYITALEQTRQFEHMLRFIGQRLSDVRPMTQGVHDLLTTSRVVALEELGRDAEAEQALHAAIAASRAGREPNLDQVLTLQLSLARIQIGMGRHDDAARTLEAARPIAERQANRGITFEADEWALLQARVWAATGEPAKAGPLVERVIGADRPHRDAAHKALAQSVLAEVRSAQGRHDEALALHTAALGVLRDMLGEDHLFTVTQMESLASAQVTAGRRHEALTTMARVVALTNQALGPNHPRTQAREARLAGWRAG
ncbi:MAG: tetratricopeptide repeat protein [Pseudomonadota bacterium]